jgi:hypothetical protein
MTFAKTQGFFRACFDSFSFYVGSLKGKVTNCISETSLLQGYIPDTTLYADVALSHYSLHVSLSNTFVRRMSF